MSNAANFYPNISITVENVTGNKCQYRNLFSPHKVTFTFVADNQSQAIINSMAPGHHYSVNQTVNSRQRTSWVSCKEIDKYGKPINVKPIQQQIDELRSDVSNMAKIIEAGLLEM